MRDSARRVVLDLLSAAPGGSLEVRGIVRACALFGHAENAVRVALARLRAAELVTVGDRGVYVLAPGAEALKEHVTTWRDAERRTRVWSGGWVGVFTADLVRGDRGLRQRRERALALLGFASLREGLFVRPDNLRGGVDGLRARLVALGLEPTALVVALDLPASERAERRWDVRALETSYRRWITELDKTGAKLPSLGVERAALESFLVGGRAIRAIVFDPLLPAPMIDVELRGQFIDAMRRFDRLGRAAWRDFLGLPLGPELHDPAELSAHG